jgi:polyisoprenoid-binding protein YceI
MTARYTFAPDQSRFTVQAFAAGLLSFAAHSPTFAVRDFHGTIDLDEGGRKVTALALTVKADSLDLLDRVSASDRAEIETRMRRDVLETANYPEIAFRATDLANDAFAPGRSRLRVGGRLSLHGAAPHCSLVAELQLHDDALRIVGISPLRLSEYRIKPVTALGGTIRLKDDLKLTFDLIAIRDQEGS